MKWSRIGPVVAVALAGALLATAPAGAAPVTGAFVIGDGNSALGAAVEFWGAQWSGMNVVSEGPAPADFKGWATTVVQTGACSGTFTTEPGNSSSPPAQLGTQIEVLVANNVTESGPIISGTFTDIATVTTDPGYGNNPGHAGTGTILSLCSQSGGGTG